MSIAENIPPVKLPGSDNYWWAYEAGNSLEGRFPGQDASDFVLAIEYNDAPFDPETAQINDFVCEQFGERDEGSWIWRVGLVDGRQWRFEGWCDFTGWDCQSGLSWEEL